MRYALWLDDHEATCGAVSQASDAVLNCNATTIRKIRSDLAAAKQLGEAERAVVEAAIRWYSDGGVNTLQMLRYSISKLKALRSAVGKWQADALPAEPVVKSPR